MSQQRRLGDLVKLTSGKSPSSFRFAADGIPYFKVDQLGKSSKYLTNSDTPYFAKESPTVPTGSVLIAKRGAAIALDRVRIIRQSSFMDTNVMALTPTDELDGEYLFYWLAKRGLWDIADVTSVPQINNKHINPLQITLPPLREQRKVVNHLSDVDSLIDALERLISKKRAIKQGLMQELLTGRTRLSGFTKPWKNISIARHSHLKARIGWQGLTTGEYLQSGSYKLIGGTDFRNARIDWESASFVSKWRFDQDRNIQLRVNDVLITKDGTIGKVAIVDSLPFPATLNSGVFVVRPIQGAYESRFLYWLLRSSVFENFIASLSAGSTINHLYQKDLITLTLAFPEDASEQREISSVLDDAESEIRVLEARLETARNIKQGMMQELLTGRTRLPVEEVSS
ncbi:type I restriction-modification system specificity subunit [Corynebacterium casei UCMA 3821]|uniref:Type I restriction-modification system specificity subunit n=1 Tax=Corynebacterium casei UCMA 3821 TaxID=1110505 RepID=G7I096_9CORY|nr:restriction endonuclease subunit S [Corynebacterium casei]CCE55861.1 type I restriction-modification system specificity subunit [Corynebacterium casei UCMA 3821]